MAKSWINKVVGWMKGQGFSPVMATSGKSFATRPCPHCGFKNAVLFTADKQDGVFAVCCMRCKKRAVRAKATDGPSNPIEAAAEGMRQGLKARKGKCLATTQTGALCDNRAKGDTNYCGIHKNWVTTPGF